jgi:hypothetical protein
MLGDGAKGLVGLALVGGKIAIHGDAERFVVVLLRRHRCRVGLLRRRRRRRLVGFVSHDCLSCSARRLLPLSLSGKPAYRGSDIPRC